MGKFIIMIGLVLLVASLNPSGTIGRSMQATDTSYTAQFIMVTRDFNLVIQSYEGETFSLYVLTERDACSLLENSSIDTLNPLLAKENISEYQGIVAIPSPGWYSVCIESDDSETAQVDFLINGVIPIMSFFSVGVLLIIVGTLVLVLDRYWMKLQNPQQKEEPLSRIRRE